MQNRDPHWENASKARMKLLLALGRLPPTALESIGLSFLCLRLDGGLAMRTPPPLRCFFIDEAGSCASANHTLEPPHDMDTSYNHRLFDHHSQIHYTGNGQAYTGVALPPMAVVIPLLGHGRRFRLPDRGPVQYARGCHWLTAPPLR